MADDMDYEDLPVPAERARPRPTKSGKSRHRAPRAILAGRGTLDTVRHRDQRDAPVIVDPIGAPPDYLDDEEKKVWKEIVALAPAGVLTSVDQMVVEQLACLMRKARARHWDIPAPMNTRITSLLGLLGMTPADRSRVSAPRRSSAADSNPYE